MTDASALLPSSWLRGRPRWLPLRRSAASAVLCGDGLAGLHMSGTFFSRKDITDAQLADHTNLVGMP